MYSISLTKLSTLLNSNTCFLMVTLSFHNYKVSENSLVYVVIMGGDGSLAQTIKELRKDAEINV